MANKCTAKAKPGRPTKYNPKYCEELIKYFNIEPHFETPVVTTFKDGTTKEEVKLIPSDLPTIAGFASKLGVHRDTLYEWAKQDKEFSDTLKLAKEFQEHILVTNALQDLYAQPFAVFTAKNVLNWRDKQEHEITGKDGKDLFEGVPADVLSTVVERATNRKGQTNS